MIMWRDALGIKSVNQYMLIQGKHYRTIWLEGESVKIIDQRFLPFQFIVESIDSVDAMYIAIKDMHLRGAPLIGVAGAWGAYLSAKEVSSKYNKICDDSLKVFNEFISKLLHSRPTAVNLAWALERHRAFVSENEFWVDVVQDLKREAEEIAEEDVKCSEQIGEHGCKIIENIAKTKNGKPVNILTHCNAGWLATVDYGTAISPIYKAQEAGIKLHVWVDETRPRLQGAKLTAFELFEQGVPHTIIPDSGAGHIMQHGLVDLCIVGSDRTTRCGDVANKIGTYLKALAAKANKIPFYAALPSSTIDWGMKNGIAEIPIEERAADEINVIEGKIVRGKDVENNPANELVKVAICDPRSKVANYAFDVTPRDLITGIITERGVANASEESLLTLYPEQR